MKISSQAESIVICRRGRETGGLGRRMEIFQMKISPVQVDRGMILRIGMFERGIELSWEMACQCALAPILNYLVQATVQRNLPQQPSAQQEVRRVAEHEEKSVKRRHDKSRVVRQQLENDMTETGVEPAIS
jgi:hypothetical protein